MTRIKRRKQTRLAATGKSKRRPSAASARASLDPVAFMLSVMRDPDQALGVRCAMAKAAAPFLRARLASTTVTGEGDGPLQVESAIDEAELARRIAFLLAKAMQGQT
jgi:hypothetical protein